MYRRFLLTLAIAGTAIGCSNDSSPNTATPDAPTTMHVDRSTLTNVGTAMTPLDYSNPALWLCRNDIDANDCAKNIDSTEVALDNSLKAAPHMAAANPAFDCFYVYPTVTFGQANDTDFSSTADQDDALLGQAARFSRVCRVFAPLYRQVGLGANGQVVMGANPLLGVGDARAAFQYYL